MPTVRARLRLIVERLTAPFTKEEVWSRARDFCPSRAVFNHAWHGIVYQAALVENANSGTWEYRPYPLVEAVRAYFRAHPRQEVLARDMRHLVTGNYLNWRTIESALDCLAAEGYRIEIKHRTTKPKAIYRVYPPEARENC